jgi:two-component system, cell cycle sensor histidine kinase PleC
MVLAANAGGLSALGLTPAERLPAPLDSAMPAVGALRDWIGSAAVQGESRALIFWRHERAIAWCCDLSNPEPTAPDHVCVVFRPTREPEAPPLRAGQPLNGAANDDTPPRIVRDDGETLKEIARRIREDTAARFPQSNSGPEPSLDLPEPSANQQDQPPRETPVAVSTRDAHSLLPSHDIAKLAHELKTPLSAIAAAAEIMRDEQLGKMGNETYLGYAADIHDSATHALAVISAMLSSPDSEPAAQNAAAPARGVFDLSDLAERAVSVLRPLAAQHNIALGLDTDPSLIGVHANETAIRQILFNLLTNALKFTPPGGEIRVATGYLDDGSVFLVVRDTGDGMTDEAMAHTFGAHAETFAPRAGGGRGIGLRLVRRLAAENGVKFEIDSAAGKGTVVLLAFAHDDHG